MTTTKRRETAAEKDERIVAEAGPWVPVLVRPRKPHSNLSEGLRVVELTILLPMNWGGTKSLRDVLDAHDRILNRLRKKGKA